MDQFQNNFTGMYLRWSPGPDPGVFQNCSYNLILCLKTSRLEKVVAKGEIAHYDLVFISKSAANASKCICKWERVENSLYVV